MAKIKNVSGETRRLAVSAGGRLVLDGQVIVVKPEQVYGYTQQSIWEPVDDEAKQAHEDAHQAYLDAIAEELRPVGEQPAAEAPREAWVGYVVGRGLASADELAAKSRDEIRELYGVDLEPGAGDEPPVIEQPGGNASREVWVGYVVGRGLATAEELAELSRDEIRDQYKQEG